jgi:MEMO1 family protein
MRQPNFAGTFYEENKEKLLKQIETTFTSKHGPGKIIENKGNTIIGVVAPHAGYFYSGQCAAHAYKAIAESKKPEIIIILGTNHAGTEENLIQIEDYQTPLGITKVDTEFCQKLKQNCNLKENPETQNKEHSIEVQIPFLQYIFKENIKIAPIIISYASDYKQIAQGIAKTIQETKKNVCIIASSDFTHYGVNYGYVPFTDNVEKNIYKLDSVAIKHITNLDTEKFVEYTQKKEATICGATAIATMTETCKILGSTQGKLLKYYTSGDITMDYNNAVGYAAIIIEKDSFANPERH